MKPGKFLRYSVFLTLLFLYPLLLGAQSVSVDINHWLYRYLDRMETKGLFIREDLNIRPLTREAVAKLLLVVADAEDRGELTRPEAGLLRQLLGEFHVEVEKLRPGASFDPDFIERNLVHLRTRDLQAHFDGLLGQRFRLESKQPVDLGIPKSTTSYGMQARVRLKQSMVINVEARAFFLSDIDTLANTAFNPSLGLPVTKKALVGVATTDNVRSTVKFALPWFDLEMGRDLVEWGPGARGNLLLSRNSNYYDMIKTTFKYKRVRFEYLHAFLNADNSKYLVAHRLEFQPVNNLLLAVSESVVYGERSVEPLYLNPFVPFIIAERHLGNKDNNMIAFDGAFFLPSKRLKLYGEVLFDDFSFANSIFGSWVNKWGVLVGSHWVDPFGLKNSEFRFEAVRMQPFVYSHRQARNTYSNYTNAIGHWLGPDADDWFFELTHRPHKNLKLSLSWEQRRRAQNDIKQGARPVDGKTRFLAGAVERNRYYGANVEWQLMRDLFLTADYHFIQSKDLHRKAGLSQSNHRLFLNVALNY